MQELVSFAPKHTETELRSILGCFLFTGDDVFKKIKVLSGGEKSRVALAKALTADANFLILDEPTNHLDIQSVNILIQALQQFEGTLIVVSHDRYFLDNIANKIWFIENHDIKEYPGTYQEYEPWYAKRKLQVKEEPLSVAEKPKQVKEAPPSDDKAKQIKKLNQELAKMEEEIAGLEKSVKDIEAKLADEDLYKNASEANQVSEEYQLKKLQLTEVQTKWESLAEQILELES